MGLLDWRNLQDRVPLDSSAEMGHPQRCRRMELLEVFARWDIFVSPGHQSLSLVRQGRILAEMEVSVLIIAWLVMQDTIVMEWV